MSRKILVRRPMRIASLCVLLAVLVNARLPGQDQQPGQGHTNFLNRLAFNLHKAFGSDSSSQSAAASESAAAASASASARQAPGLRAFYSGSGGGSDSEDEERLLFPGLASRYGDAAEGALGGSTLTARPIIGVVAIPGGPAPQGWSYIAASYIKWLEQGGLRVAPIFFDEPKSSLERKLRYVNGLLIPGGVDIAVNDGGPGEQLYENTRYLLEASLRFNQDGTHFPVHGIGLGMEMIMRYFSQGTIDFFEIEAADLAGPLIFEGTTVMSRFFSNFKMSMLQYMSVKPVAWHTHPRGVSRGDFYDNRRLVEDLGFYILTRSIDANGRKYVSTIESERYPFTASQWHPEKAPYEWSALKRIPHDYKAVLVSQYVSNFIAAEARMSSHKPNPGVEEENLLIYNYNATYSGKTGGHQGKQDDLTQIYFFPPWDDMVERGMVRA